MSSKTSDDGVSLISKVESYFFEDDDFANLFENFANDNAHIISPDDDENGFRLEYTDLHKKFLELFEGTLSKFIEGLGATIEDFYEEVRQVRSSCCCLFCFCFRFLLLLVRECCDAIILICYLHHQCSSGLLMLFYCRVLKLMKREKWLTLQRL